MSFDANPYQLAYGPEIYNINEVDDVDWSAPTFMGSGSLQISRRASMFFYWVEYV